MGFCAPWDDYFINNNKKLKHRQQQKMDSCWNFLDHSITLLNFVLLGPTLTYTTSNLNNLRDCLESNKFIGGNRCNHKKRNPHHNLPQSCRGFKYVCAVWIHPTDNLQSHLRTSSSINEIWSDKYDTHKSTIKKIRLGQRTRRIFYIK